VSQFGGQKKRGQGHRCLVFAEVDPDLQPLRLLILAFFSPLDLYYQGRDVDFSGDFIIFLTVAFVAVVYLQYLG